MTHRVTRLFAVFVFALLGASSAHAACDIARPPLDALVAANLKAARENYADVIADVAAAEDSLGCVVTALTPELLGGLYQVGAFAAFQKDDPRAAGWLASAVRLAPELAPDPRYGADFASKHAAAAQELKKLGKGRLVAAGPMLVDGVWFSEGESRKLPRGEHIVQTRKDDGSWSTERLELQSDTTEDIGHAVSSVERHPVTTGVGAALVVGGAVGLATLWVQFANEVESPERSTVADDPPGVANAWQVASLAAMGGGLGVLVVPVLLDSGGGLGLRVRW